MKLFRLMRIFCALGFFTPMHAMEKTLQASDSAAEITPAVLAELQKLSSNTALLGNASLPELTSDGLQALTRNLSAIKQGGEALDVLVRTLYQENLHELFALLATTNSLGIQSVISAFFTFLEKEVTLDFTSLLLKAASSGQKGVLEVFLKHVNVDSKDKEGNTALILATKAGHREVVQVLP